MMRWKGWNRLVLCRFFGVLVGGMIAAGAAYLARKYLLMRAGQETKETEMPDQQPAVRVFGAFAPSTEAPRGSDPYMEAQ